MWLAEADKTTTNITVHFLFGPKNLFHTSDKIYGNDRKHKNHASLFLIEFIHFLES